MADVDGIRADLTGSKKVVIVGAGYIGLEAAASARHLGLDVTVLEMADRPLNRVTAPEMSTFYMHRHEREGVRVLCGMSVSSFREGSHGRVGAVACGEREFEADFVIVGVGILPETTLAAAAGLSCENGHLVDGTFRTEARVQLSCLAALSVLTYLVSQVFYAGLRFQLLNLFLVFLFAACFAHVRDIKLSKKIVVMIFLIGLLSAGFRLKNFYTEAGQGDTPFAPYHFFWEQ